MTMIGRSLGRYEVIAKVGAGGMGEVYRARDGRLHRDVAIKILPESVARDEVSRARFEREAQAIAALSHPNVLAVFDTGVEDTHLYVVTELLEGETLRDRLRHGPVAVRRAIEWAAGIAHGLAAAHEKHVGHRDLKPENLFLTADGRVKILDFGLAKTPAPAAPNETAAETVQAITGDGVVLGTVGYMAPEQVRGLAVDGRTDVFALGVVLYEMLSGQRAFHRDTAADTVTAILREEPSDLSAVRRDLPPGIERIVRHCLEKNPKERFQSAHDVAFALESLSAPTVASGAATTTAGARRSPAFVAAALLGAAALAAAAWWGAMKVGSPSPTAPALTIGAAAQITANDGLEIDAALSPDGKLLAYSAGHARQMRVYIRPVAGGRVLTLSEGDAAFEYQPRWSPDGSQILFLRPEGVFVASSLGGAARQIAAGRFTSAGWLPDGARVLLARVSTVAVVPLAGGAEQQLAAGGDDLHSCAWSPVNEWIACASGNSQAVLPGRGFGNVAPSGIVLIPATGGAFITAAERTLVNLSPVWSPDGRQLYFVSNREGPRDVYVRDIDPGGPRGEPRRVTTGLGVQSIAFSSAFNRLAYVTSVMRANIWSLPIPSGAPVDTSGAQPVTNGTQVIEGMNASVDGKWLVFDSTLHLNAEILRVPIIGGTVERLTRDPVDDFAPDLSPDGRQLAYHSWKTGSRDIFVQPLDGGPVQRLTNTADQESYPRWSLDGRAVAFVSQEQFRREVVHGDMYLTRRQDNGGWSPPTLVTKNVATRVAWMRRGASDVLVFAREGSIVVITPQTGATETISAPVAGSSDPEAWSVAVSPEGSTLYFKSADASGFTTLWSMPSTGGKPRLLVRFADPSRQSLRPDFTVAGGKLFFTIEDRQADIWVAEVGKK